MIKPYRTRLDDPTPEELRACIQDGHCWWCGRTGFINLAKHTSSIHGITASEIRDIAGFFKNQPTCTEDHSSNCRVRLMAQLDDGRRIMPKAAKGYRVQFSKAGRTYQDNDRTRFLAAVSNEQRADNSRKSAWKRYKPHACPECGKMLPTASPKTCSPECRKLIRVRTGRISAQTRKRLKLENPEYKARLSANASKAAKLAYMTGTRTNPVPPKPHPCPICGTIVPKASPILCSPECRSIFRQQVAQKVQNNRTLKISRNEREVIALRFRTGESSTAIARDYCISPRYVRLIGQEVMPL